MNEKIIVGERIKKARLNAGFTQEELGKKIGFSAMGISYLENGSRKIKIEDLQKISSVLGFELGYFLDSVPNTSVNYPSAFYRRGNDELSVEELRTENDSVSEFKNFLRQSKERK